MAARKRISEVNITSSGQFSGNFSQHNPHNTDLSLKSEWFEHLLAEVLLGKTGSRFKLPIDTTGNEYIEIDRGLISSITITLS